MKLTAGQVKQLCLLRVFRESPPTVLNYFKVNWKSSLVIAVACAGTSAAYYWVGSPIVSGFFGGTLFGVLARDAGWYRKLVHTWPLSREITDWHRVDELIEYNMQPQLHKTRTHLDG